jgi:hypothetical protein
VADAADRGRCKCRRSLNRFGSFWRTVRAGPRIPHERTALPEVQHADEAYAGTAEHAPIRAVPLVEALRVAAFAPSSEAPDHNVRD